MKIKEWFKNLFKVKDSKSENKLPDTGDMKKFLIVCLGNPGAEYEDTRHNVGYMTGNLMAYDAGVGFKSCRYGEMAKIKVKNCELWVLKPTTFMNLSGVAVRYWMDKEKFPLSNILVIVDDVSLPFGTVRIREKGSDAGHNGLKDIAEQLGTQDYARLKFGIGNDFPKGGLIDYVLGKFPKEEKKELPEKLNIASDAIKTFCLSGAAFAMNRFNR